MWNDQRAKRSAGKLRLALSAAPDGPFVEEVNAPVIEIVAGADHSQLTTLDPEQCGRCAFTASAPRRCPVCDFRTLLAKRASTSPCSKETVHA